MDLIKPMEMGSQCLMSMLDPEHDHMITGGFGIGHDTGRWWDAMLRYEKATGNKIPEFAETAMLRNLQVLADNPDGILFIPTGLDWTSTRFEVHSLRETLIAFTALIRERNSSWAEEAALKMLRTVKRILRADGTLDTNKLDYIKYASEKDRENITHCSLDGTDYTAVTGRFIEALVWHYEETGEPLALELAQVFADYHLEHTVNRDGSPRQEIFSKNNWGHSHSYLGTLRGLLLYGFLTDQRIFIDTVATTHRNAVRVMVTESGHVSHDLGMLVCPDDLGNPVAECTSAGDAAQIALWLALRNHQTDLFDFTEQIVRARILPCQIQDSDARNNPNMPIYERNVGGWGGCEYPYSTKGCTAPDYVAAVLHTLIDVYDNIVTYTDSDLRINLHFNYEDENFRSVCQRDEKGVLTVQVKTSNNILIRIPGWSPTENIVVSIDKERLPVNMMGNFLFVSREQAVKDSEIIVEYDLPEQMTSETTYMGQVYKFAWKGDEITGISPNPGPRPIYPTWVG